MTAAVETMAWSGEKPWHGLGVEVGPSLTPAEIICAAKLDWTVSARPIFMEDGKLVTSYRMLIRDSDESQFGICGNQYVPFQNEEVFKFFNKFTKAGSMTMETAGSLKGGQHVWGLAKIAKGFSLPGGDDVEGYLLLSQPHQWGKSMVIKFTPTRVVCNNTLTYALKHDVVGDFSQPHITSFDNEIIVKAETALGLCEKQMLEFEEKARFLASKEFSDTKVNAFIANLFQKDLLSEKQKEPDYAGDAVVDFQQFKKTADTVRSALSLAPGSDLPTKNTWWAAANAVSYVVDHRLGRERDSGMMNAWFGRGSSIKRNAIELAVKYAEAA